MPEPANPLVTVLDQPFNAETPSHLLSEAITPTASFFVRSHFDVPPFDVAAWRLTIDGLVDKSVQLSLDELKRGPTKTIAVTMECAGNGRTSLSPRPSGVAWGYGAAATATFTGTPLKHLLDLASPGRALEVVFTAADSGDVEGQTISFARSLPLAIARLPDTLVAWDMNGAPLPPHHGAPARLVVPGWYGMAAVKWLERITLVDRPFGGHFQQKDYVYLRQAGVPDGTPITLMRVRSVIAHPSNSGVLPLGPIEITGTAWSGGQSIRKVELSTDDARTWKEATLSPSASENAATPWRFAWQPKTAGEYVICARATDDAGNAQPTEPVWNLRGYGNNAIQRIRVTIK